MRPNWADGYENITTTELDALREIMRVVCQQSTFTAVAHNAGVNVADLRNFTKAPPSSQRPARERLFRMLRYALASGVERKHPNLDRSVEILRKFLTRNSIEFIYDEDYFFLHLERLGIIDEPTCQDIANKHAGKYYLYRLGRSADSIIRSHMEIRKFDPINRVPYFLNQLRYDDTSRVFQATGAVNQEPAVNTGNDNQESAVNRAARGHMAPMGHFYVFLGFVHQGSIADRTPKYEGVQINIFPQQTFDERTSRSVQGVFMSYVFNERYEFGPIIIKKTEEARNSAQIGNFQTKTMHAVLTFRN